MGCGNVIEPIKNFFSVPSQNFSWISNIILGIYSLRSIAIHFTTLHILKRNYS